MASSANQPILHMKPYYIPEDTQKAVTNFLVNAPRDFYDTLTWHTDIFIPRTDPSVEVCFARITLILAMHALADISYSPWIIVRRSFLYLRSSLELQARRLDEVNEIRNFLLRVEGKLVHYTKEVLASEENKARRNWLMGHGANGRQDVTRKTIDLRVVKEYLLYEWDHTIRNIDRTLGEVDSEADLAGENLGSRSEETDQAVV